MVQPELNRTSTDVYTMPLTEVSIEHGTKGLQRRLQHALGQAGLADNELIQASIKLGLDLHRDDERTYEPVNNHIVRVTIRLIEELGITDPVIVAAAPLHDAVEDQLRELITRFLNVQIPTDLRSQREFGYQALRTFGDQYHAPQIAGKVQVVTNPLWTPGYDKIPQYTQHIKNIMSNKDPENVPLKIADPLDNMDVPEGLENPAKRVYLDRKQIPTYKLLEAGLMRTDSLIVGKFREQTLMRLRTLRAEAVARLGYDPEDSDSLESSSLRSA